MELGLAGQVFVVTAASGGLGRATAEALLADGARVVLVARRADVLAEAVAPHGDAATYLAADLTDSATAQAAVALALERFGRLDGALISVGGPPKGSVLGSTEDEWRAAFDQVFLAGLRVARAVVSGAAGPVALAFVLSTSVKEPLPAMSLSNGLRPGLGILVKQLADEIGPDGSRVIGLMPATIATERIHYLYGQTPDPEATRKAAERAIPLRRLGEPAEFGRVAAFLLSPAAGYVTGSVIAVDGGGLRSL